MSDTYGIGCIASTSIGCIAIVSSKTGLTRYRDASIYHREASQDRTMAKTRSPEYPAIGLKEAVEKVRAVWLKDYQNRVPKQVVAEHMGYKGLNGGSLPIISALSKFGLIEGRADETRVSDLGLAIVAHQPGSSERLDAVQTAATNPELFKELDGRFLTRGSDAAIRSYLLTQKFIPGAADAAIRSYRETKELVDAEREAYARANPEAAFQGEMAEQEQQAMNEGNSPPLWISRAKAAARTTTADESPSTRKEIITLDEGDVVISFPDDLSAASVADLSDHLELFIRKAQRRAKNGAVKNDEAAH